MWSDLFALNVSPLELVIRGTAIYWFLFVVFRLIMRREIGAITISDVLLLVLIADAAQNAMSGGYETVAEGIVLVSTIIGWNLLLDWAAYRSETLNRLLQPSPLPLVVDGQIMHRNLRKEFLTVKDLLAKLREKGVDDVQLVKTAIMESDGALSVVRKE